VDLDGGSSVVPGCDANLDAGARESVDEGRELERKLRAG
jgi:hypothetical protein